MQSGISPDKMPLTAYRRLGITLLFTALTAAPAYAHMGLVVAEPFGSFGTMMPAGHAAVYLDHLCVETPTQLRACRPGESGVVLSRYHDLRSTHTDWMAVPALTFFYGIDETDAGQSHVPGFMTASLEAELRESYREAHLRAVAPDRIDKHGIVHRPDYGDWDEAIGAAFDRRLFLYVIDTTPEQEASVFAYLNKDPNLRRYKLFRANCADFAADLLNVVMPGTFHRNNIADFHMMSPKQLSRLMERYGHTHPEANLTLYEVPQLPGTLRRSRPMRGAAETLLKTKRYLVTLLIIQPEAVLTSWIIYETKGKETHSIQPVVLSPGSLQSTLTVESANVPTLQGQRAASQSSTIPAPPAAGSLPTQSASAQSNKD